MRKQAKEKQEEKRREREMCDVRAQYEIEPKSDIETKLEMSI